MVENNSPEYLSLTSPGDPRKEVVVGCRQKRIQEELRNTTTTTTKQLAVLNASKELRWMKVKTDNIKVISSYQGNKFHSALS